MIDLKPRFLLSLGADAFGLPLDFELTGGEVHDCRAAPLLIDKLPSAEATIADKGYGSEDLRIII